VASKDQKAFVADLKLIYQASTKEEAEQGFHCQARKITKTKGVFTSDISLLKLTCLTTQNIQKSGLSLCRIGA
jgi:hypothetical protein